MEVSSLSWLGKRGSLIEVLRDESGFVISVMS